MCHRILLHWYALFEKNKDGYMYVDHNRPFYSCVLSYLALNASEAGVDLTLIQTSHLFLCK